MVWFIIGALILLWLLGWGFHVAGNLIFVLPVVAFILLLFALLTRGKTI